MRFYPQSAQNEPLTYCYVVVGSNGLEPSTSRLSGVCSNQLSYEPIYWWRISESNRWPPACKAGALASWANPPFFILFRYVFYYFLARLTMLKHNKCSAIRSTLTIKTWKKERISTVLDRLGFCLQALCLQTILPKRRWSSRTFRYGYLVTTSPQSFVLP